MTTRLLTAILCCFVATPMVAVAQEGASVQVTNANRDAGNEPSVFIVPNDEYSTLSCSEPPPPAWIQRGIVIRIEVNSKSGAVTEPVPEPTIAPEFLELARGNSRLSANFRLTSCMQLRSVRRA